MTALFSQVNDSRDFDLAWPVLSRAVGRPDNETRARLSRLYLGSGATVELWAYGPAGGPPLAVVGIRLGDPGEITHIAVQAGCDRQGFGRRLFAEVVARHPETSSWMAETDDDAVGFYRALGFLEEALPPGFPGVTRYRCTWSRAGTDGTGSGPGPTDRTTHTGR